MFMICFGLEMNVCRLPGMCSRSARVTLDIPWNWKVSVFLFSVFGHQPNSLLQSVPDQFKFDCALIICCTKLQIKLNRLLSLK